MSSNKIPKVKQNPFVLLAAGGTGGHLFAATAMAESLHEKGINPIIATDHRGKSLCRAVDEEIVVIPVKQFWAKLIKLKLPSFSGMISLMKSVIMCKEWMKVNRPVLILGFGGYPSAPVIMAAILLKVPYILHEQNTVLGRIQRIFQKKALVITSGFSDLAKISKNAMKKLCYTGNPVRKAIAEQRKSEPRTFKSGETLNILVLGGSQGASVFSKVVPEGFAMLSDKLKEQIVIFQQARAEDVDRLKLAYHKLGIKAVVKEFFEDMGEVLSNVHVAICRSGAGTITELTCVGIPALFVPYPYATDDHQLQNAKEICSNNAGWYIEEKHFTPGYLYHFILNIFSDSSELSEAAKSMHSLYHEERMKALLDWINDSYFGGKSYDDHESEEQEKRAS